MLRLNNLHVSVDGTEILKGIDLEIKPGEVHASVSVSVSVSESTIRARIRKRKRARM